MRDSPVNMELKDFIKSTITQIKESVEELNEEFEEGKVIVNPLFAESANRSMIRANGANITDIDFDLSLSVTETDGKEGKIGIMSSIIGMGASTKNDNQNISINRIQFTIPVMLPYKRPYN